MQLQACKEHIKMNYDHLKANNPQSFCVFDYTSSFFLVRPKSWQTNLDPGVVPTIASKNIHMHKIATTYYV